MVRLLPLVFVIAACAEIGPGPSSGSAPMRSPTLDYPLPDVQTADGHPLGADGMRIEDKLQTSPRVGSDGITPAAVPPQQESRPAPARKVDPSTEDPLCEVLGVRRSVRRQRCPETPPPAP